MNQAPRTPSAEDLTLLARIASDAARARHLSETDAQDFTQSVHVRIIERDYDVFGRFEGRSSLRTYLTTVVNRLMLDWLNRNYGKWRASATARRIGEPATTLDRLMNRDGYSIDEAVDEVARRQDDESRRMLRRMAAQIPRRVRRRFVSPEMLDLCGGVPFEDPVTAEDDRRAKEHIDKALLCAMRQLPGEERRLMALRYQQRQPVHLLAAQLSVEPKVLYRRFERTLRSLRETLMAAGVTGPGSVAFPTTALGTGSGNARKPLDKLPGGVPQEGAPYAT